MAEDPRVRSAARLAEAFHTDPIQILDSSEDEWLIRMAAAQSLAKDHEEARKKAKQQRN